jgi:hypothetical protein
MRYGGLGNERFQKCIPTGVFLEINGNESWKRNVSNTRNIPFHWCFEGLLETPLETPFGNIGNKHGNARGYFRG